MHPGGQDAPNGDAFQISRMYTLKGLRYHVSRERFLESIACSAGQEV